MPTTAVVRHQAEKSGLAPLARSPCRIGYCAIPINRNDGLAALRYRNLTTRILPDGRAARAPSGQAPILNPHRLATGAAPTCHAGPRFPPPRLLGRLPPEHVASFFSGRRPRSLNELGGSVPVARTAGSRGILVVAAPVDNRPD